MSWPLGEDEWQGQLPAARAEYAELVKAIAAVERVELLVADDECEGDARSRLSADFNLGFHRQPLDDCWFRDNGPTFVRREDGRVAALCWDFNAWGQKYPFSRDAVAAQAVLEKRGLKPARPGLVMEGGGLEGDGQGTLLTTRSCLLHPRRNPGLGEREIESALRHWLGVNRVLWLNEGLQGDHTDGHIDTLTRFVRPGCVLTSVCSKRDDNFAVLEANRRQLASFGLEVRELPIPDRRRTFLGVRLPETYANFYLCNGSVIVPQYGDLQDQAACSIIGECFPERTLVALSAQAIITSGGAFHCLTQQQPEGELCNWD